MLCVNTPCVVCVCVCPLCISVSVNNYPHLLKKDPMGFRLGRSFRLKCMTIVTVVLVHSMSIRPSGMIVYYKSETMHTLFQKRE